MFSVLYKYSNELRQAKFISLLDEDPSATYLDIGVDDGEFTKRCLEKIKPQEAFGVDYKNNIKADLTLSAKGKTKLELLVADICDGIPGTDASIDAITCSQVIEHLQNTDAFLMELYRILKPDGYIVLSTENLSSWDDIFAILLGYRPFSSEYSYSCLVGNPFSPHNNEDRTECYDPTSGRFYGHNKVFTMKAMRAILLLHGFDVINMYGAGYYPFPFKFLMRLFSRVDRLHSKFMVVKIKKKADEKPLRSE